MSDRRILLPIGAAILLVIVCVLRLATNRPQSYSDQVAVAVVLRPARIFEALDSDNHLVRLGTFLGRHKIIVLFFDGETDTVPGDANPTPAAVERMRTQLADLIRLRDRMEELRAHDVKVVAVSAVIPQRNRASMQSIGKFPFPLVSDFDPTAPEGALRIHRQWGRLDPDTGKPLTGIFLIDRKGQLPFGVGGPIPLKNIDQAISEALK